MSILIKGMEMPKTYPQKVTIYPDGQVLLARFGTKDVHGTAVPVPSHGRLIDADALDADLEWQDMHTGEWDAVGFSIEEIENAPTIIPTEEGE